MGEGGRGGRESSRAARFISEMGDAYASEVRFEKTEHPFLRYFPLLYEVEERGGRGGAFRSDRNKPLSPCPLPAALRREREKTCQSFG